MESKTDISKDLLDLELNKDFIMDIIDGNEQNFSILKNWYYTRKLQKPEIDKQKQFLFDMIVHIVNVSKQKDEEIKKLKEQIERINIENSLESFDLTPLVFQLENENQELKEKIKEIESEKNRVQHIEVEGGGKKMDKNDMEKNIKTNPYVENEKIKNINEMQEKIKSEMK